MRIRRINHADAAIAPDLHCLRIHLGTAAAEHICFKTLQIGLSIFGRNQYGTIQPLEAILCSGGHTPHPGIALVHAGIV